MADADMQLKATDVLINMHTAIKNVQLYPLSSPTVTISVDKLYMLLLDVLSYDAPFSIAESEKKLMLNGKLLNQRDQETIHVTILLDILLRLGVKVIFLDKGLEKEELKTFIRVIAQKSETILNEGGLDELMRKNKFVHIYLGKDINAVTNREKAKDQGAGHQDDVVSHLMGNLSSKDTETRIQAAGALAEIIEQLPTIQQRDLIRILSGQLIQWITLETTVTPAYKEICHGLQMLIQDLISRERFTEASSLMNVFSKIHSGELKKNDEIKDVSLKILQNLALEDNLQILFKGLNSEDKTEEAEAGSVLVGFGDIILNKLLDIVRDVSNSNERIRVIHLILSMGSKAIPAITNRINGQAPWYYLRNLAYILGHIGNEQSAPVLQPLLLHSNEKVKMEALKSIGQTGGKQRGTLLTSVLPQADDKLKLYIIEMLGRIKCTNAVANLLDMLKNKPAVAKDFGIPLQEKICNALGAIGSSEAIPVLTEIAESKSFFGIRSYPVEIKYAAKRALESIQRKQKEHSGGR